jgi:hypothetical protein
MGERSKFFASAAVPFRFGAARICPTDFTSSHADLLGGDLEPRSILPPIILNQAIAAGFAHPLGFVHRLRTRNHISDLFAVVYVDAIADRFPGAERGARLDIVFSTSRLMTCSMISREGATCPLSIWARRAS